MNNLVVKMMSSENLADSNTSKGFTLVESWGEVKCCRDEYGKPVIEVPLEDRQTAIYRPEGNTYLIKNGKTVATFNYALQSNSAVTALAEIKQIQNDYMKYHNDSIVIADAADLVDIEIKEPYVMILVEVIPSIAPETLDALHLEYLTKVVNPDAGVVFAVYANKAAPALKETV